MAGILKKYSHISNKRAPNCLIEKFRLEFLNLEPENALFGFLDRIVKNYCHFSSNKRPPNCVTPKFRAKNRILKSVTKICLIQVFCAGILKNHYHI